MQNPQFNQQVAQAHRQTLLHEAQQEQLLAQLPPAHHNLVHAFAARLTMFLIAIRTRLKQLAPRRQRILSD
jgi:hypothetical protein